MDNNDNKDFFDYDSYIKAGGKKKKKKKKPVNADKNLQPKPQQKPASKSEKAERFK